MIFDKENMFFKDQALSATTLTSDVIDVGPGEASNPMHMVVDVTPDAGPGKVTVDLQTSADSSFASYSVLGQFESKTYTTSFAISDDTLAHVISAQIPRGNQGYLRTSVTSTFSDGEMTSAIVMDDDILTADS